MGKRGPRPTPKAVLEARGSRRADRGRSELKAPPGRPSCPSWLGKDERKVWRSLVPILEEMGVLTKADAMALGRYCRIFIRWRRAEDFLEQNGEMHPLKDGNGRVKCFMPFPQVGTAAKLAALLTRMEQEFGLTPSARTRVEIAPAFKAGMLQSAMSPAEAEMERRRREFFSRPASGLSPRAVGEDAG